MSTRLRIAITLGLLLSVSLEAPALAATERPVTWADMSNLDLKPILKSPYASTSHLMEPDFAPSAYEVAVRDADNLVHPEFDIPKSLEANVRFWLRVYTEFTTQHVVIFDRRHPEVVYDVLDFRELSKKSRNRAAYEIVSERRVNAAVRGYREAFAKLARNPHPKSPSEYQRKILAALKKTRHKHTFKELTKNLRAQTGQRDNIMKGLVAAERYFPQMEQMFAERGLPADLTRLSLVESSFNLNAISKVGATGVWQFMHKSALEYMVVDSKRGLDERLSPLKSTIAAAKLLKRNRKILGSWMVAITSYNHGLRSFFKIPAEVRKSPAIVKIFEPCNERSPLGWASRNYYSEFLAVLYAEKYREAFYGHAPETLARPVAFERLAGPKTPLDFAMERGIPLQDFRFYNPDIRHYRNPLPRGYWIAVPSQRHDDVALENSTRPNKRNDAG